MRWKLGSNIACKNTFKTRETTPFNFKEPLSHAQVIVVHFKPISCKYVNESYTTQTATYSSIWNGITKSRAWISTFRITCSNLKIQCYLPLYFWRGGSVPGICLDEVNTFPLIKVAWTKQILSLEQRSSGETLPIPSLKLQARIN